MSGRFYCEATVSLSSGKTFRRFSTLRWFWKTTPRRLCKQQHWGKWAPSARRSAAPSARRLRWNAARSELGITFVVSRPAGIGNPGRAEASYFHSGLIWFKTFKMFKPLQPLLHPPPRRGGGKRWGFERFERLERIEQQACSEAP